MTLRIFIILALQAVIISQVPDNPVIGKWESINRSVTGIGAAYEFSKDGRVIYMTGAMFDYNYRVSHNRLIITFVNTQTGQVTHDTSFIEIGGDKLIQTSYNGNIKANKTLTRIYPRSISENEIVGSWKTKNVAGQTVFYNFAEDGTLYFRLPFEIKDGLYKMKNNQINFEYSDTDTVSENYRIKNGFLIFYNNTGSEQVYHKVK